MQTHPPSAAGRVLVDFDGTIVYWGQLDDPQPIPGAVEAVRRLKDLGYTIGIFTSRLSPTWHRAEGRDAAEGIRDQAAIIMRACSEFGIPYDFMTSEKVPAVLYLDDKAMRVNSDRPLLEAVLDFERGGDAAL